MYLNNFLCGGMTWSRYYIIRLCLGKVRSVPGYGYIEHKL